MRPDPPRLPCATEHQRQLRHAAGPSSLCCCICCYLSTLRVSGMLLLYWVCWCCLSRAHTRAQNCWDTSTADRGVISTTTPH